MKDPSRQHTAEAAIVLAATRIVRALLGVAIALLVAWRFGASPVTDAFFVAEAISLNLAGWLGPVLKVSIIPGLTDVRLRRGDAEARAATAQVLGLSIPVFAAGTLLLLVVASPVMFLFAPGFDATTHAEATRLTRILAPAFFLAGFFEFVECALNTNRHFSWPAVGRVLAKIGNLVGLVWLAGPLGMMGVCIGVVLGNLIQLAPQMPLTAQVAPRFWVPRLRIHPDLKPYIILLGPALLWLAIDQVNVIVDQIFASTLAPGKLSAITYAVRLVQFAANILVGSLVSASLPSFSEHMAENRPDDTRRLIGVNLRMVLFVTLPVIAGLVMLRDPLVAAFFQRGHFDPQATHDTSLALLGFSVGLASLSINMVCRVALFTNHRVKTVLRVGALEIFTNAGFDALFMRIFGHWGIPLSTSVSATLASGLLLSAVGREFGRVLDRELARSTAKSVLATGAMIAVIAALRPVVERPPFAGLHGGLEVEVGLLIAAGGLAYVLAALLLRADEMDRLIRVWKQRGGRR